MSSLKNQPITPNCCQAVKETASVCLHIDYWKFVNGDTDTPPIWTCLGYDRQFQNFNKTYEVNFCPHCATPLPEIVKRETNKKICVCTDGGYYCDTCGERLLSCNCWQPEYRWKPKC